LDGPDYTDGVGLFRTEFLYLDEDREPSEEQQYHAYRQVLLSYGDKPVTLRTLDIGGDKTVGYLVLKQEINPFLGNRALRLCFSRPELFHTQLRAALRASVNGRLQIMLPMVASIDDIVRAKEEIETVRLSLIGEGIAVSERIETGIMIEIPSIALLSDIASEMVDFASFGTNDLCQYLMAVDRLNPDVSAYYQGYNPSLFRLIGSAASEYNRRGKKVSVCGELASDPLAAAVLIGLGIGKLSMNRASVPLFKKLITRLPIERAKEIAVHVLTLPTAGEVGNYLNDAVSPILETET